MKKTVIFACALALAACSNENGKYDITGTFEATEVTVSAEGTGRLMSFTLEEGDQIAAGTQVGLIDTVQLALKARQFGATEESIANQRPDIQAQIAATKQQIAKAGKEAKRQQNLLNDNAGTQKQLDDALNQVSVLKQQLKAQMSTLDNSTKALNSQMNATAIQREQILDQLGKCHIVSPIAGTIIEKYAEQGEFAATGKPLFKVADLSNMYLRAYITSVQLKDVKLGQKVKVWSDSGDDNRQSYDGVITWISSRSEFTPKTILTDDARADQVYAVKIAVKNDGYLKIGMYGEVALQ